MRWENEHVTANAPSDAYLIGQYDKRKISLQHDHHQIVNFTIEVNVMGHGPWMDYATYLVEPGETFDHTFEDDFEARWVRVVAEKNCKATAWFIYE